MVTLLIPVGVFFCDTKLLTTVEQNIEHQISYKCAYILLSKERKDKRQKTKALKQNGSFCVLWQSSQIEALPQVFGPLIQLLSAQVPPNFEVL